jgi:hypothetical protein
MREAQRTLEESRWTFYTYHEIFVQGLDCLLNIHPSVKISSWSSQDSLVGRKKTKEANDLGFQEMASILSPINLYEGNWKTNYPYYITEDTRPQRTHWEFFVVAPPDGCASTTSLRSTNATLAIMTCVLHFEAFW